MGGSVLCPQATAYAVHNNGGDQRPLGHLTPKPDHSPKKNFLQDHHGHAIATEGEGQQHKLRLPWLPELLIDIHRSLIEIPSISGSEHDVGVYLMSVLERYDFTTQKQVVPSSDNSTTSERFNILAWPNFGHRHTNSKEDKKDIHRHRMLVTSHIDVVPPYIPYSIAPPPEEESKRDDSYKKWIIRGRGSVDAKAAVAAQITALMLFLGIENNELRSGVGPDDFMMLFVVGEEVGGDGMKYYSSVRQKELSSGEKKSNFEAAIFGEPTENKLACGHKGHLSGSIRAKGKAGHSGYPWLFQSATELLMRGLLKLIDSDLGSSDRYGNTTVNVGVLEGGVAGNVIAANASARVTVRVAAGNQTTGSHIVADKIQELLKEVDGEEGAFEVDWFEGNGYGPVECRCDVEGFENMVASYGTDVPNLEGDHVSYLYGPGSILVAHGDDEALTVGELVEATMGYVRLIKTHFGIHNGWDDDARDY